MIPAIAHAITTPIELFVPPCKPSPTSLIFNGQLILSFLVKIEQTAATAIEINNALEVGDFSSTIEKIK